MPKKGALGQFVDLRGGLARKRGGVFLRGGDTLMHTVKRNWMNFDSMCFICFCFCFFSLFICLYVHSTRLEFYISMLIYFRYGVLVNPNLVFVFLEDPYNWPCTTMVVGRKHSYGLSFHFVVCHV